MMPSRANILALPSMIDPASEERMHEARRRAWFQRQWHVIDINRRDIPGLVRQWIINDANGRFSGERK